MGGLGRGSFGLVWYWCHSQKIQGLIWCMASGMGGGVISVVVGEVYGIEGKGVVSREVLVC